jgi:hypothetical protein
MRLFFCSSRGRDRGKKATASKCRLALESLEDRTVPSVSVVSGTVTVTGTEGPDRFLIRLKPGAPATLQISDDGGSSFTETGLSSVTQINVSSGGGTGGKG